MKLLKANLLVALAFLFFSCSKEQSISTEPFTNLTEEPVYNTPAKFPYSSFKLLQDCEKLKFDTWVVDTQITSFHYGGNIWDKNPIFYGRQDLKSNFVFDSLDFDESWFSVNTSYGGSSQSKILNSNCSDFLAEKTIFTHDPATKPSAILQLIDFNNIKAKVLSISALYQYQKNPECFVYGYVDTLYLSLKTGKLDLSK